MGMIIAIVVTLTAVVGMVVVRILYAVKKNSEKKEIMRTVYILPFCRLY